MEKKIIAYTVPAVTLDKIYKILTSMPWYQANDLIVELNNGAKPILEEEKQELPQESKGKAS